MQSLKRKQKQISNMDEHHERTEYFQIHLNNNNLSCTHVKPSRHTCFSVERLLLICCSSSCALLVILLLFFSYCLSFLFLLSHCILVCFLSLSVGVSVSAVRHLLLIRKRVCPNRGSNTGPYDLQSYALPTELSEPET